MAHIHQQIREAIGTILKTGTEWNVVYETRIKPTRDVNPYLMVYLVDETIETLTIHEPTHFRRDMTYNVDAYLTITDDEHIEDQMDTIMVEVEQLLTCAALEAQIGHETKVFHPVSSERSIDEDETGRVDARLSLSWQVTVFTIEGDPETLK